MDTNIIERYLARYINRIAISKSRLSYIKHQDKLKSEVHIIYKDYRNQKNGNAAPKALKKMDPLIAIHQFMTHVLPPYFQKSRHYGIHAYQTWKKYESRISASIKRNSDTVANLFAIIKKLIENKPLACTKCKSTEFEIKPLRADPNWIFQFITLPNWRAPPLFNRKSIILF